MRGLILSILLLVISLSCLGQTKDSTSISYWTPPSWFSGDKKVLLNNLDSYKFSRKQLNELVNDVNTSSVLGVYYKYDPETHYGLVPTIKLYIRVNNTDSFDKFFQSLKNEIESVESKVLNFSFTDTPRVILIGQQKAFYACAVYNLKVKTGEVANVRTKFIGIPFEGKYLYVTLLDNEKEDCSKIFTEVISKIKVQ